MKTMNLFSRSHIFFYIEQAWLLIHLLNNKIYFGVYFPIKLEYK